MLLKPANTAALTPNFLAMPDNESPRWTTYTFGIVVVVGGNVVVVVVVTIGGNVSFADCLVAVHAASVRPIARAANRFAVRA